MAQATPRRRGGKRKLIPDCESVTAEPVRHQVEMRTPLPLGGCVAPSTVKKRAVGASVKQSLTSAEIPQFDMTKVGSGRRNKQPAERPPRASRPPGHARLPSMPDVEEPNPRQLSPSMGDYGMDDLHMDGLHGSEEEAGEQQGEVEPDAVGTGSYSVDDLEHGLSANASGAGARKSISECWKHCTKNTELVNGKSVIVSATCKYCKKELTAGSSGGTGHLNRHYASCLKKVCHARRRTHADSTQLQRGWHTIVRVSP